MLPEKLQVDFISYLEYFIEEGVEELHIRLKDTLNQKRFPSRDANQIVEGVLACSPKELRKKRQNVNYYICNALCLLDTVKTIFDKNLYDTLKKKDTPVIALHNYQHILRWILIDAEELQIIYKNNIHSDFEHNSDFDSHYIHPMSIHQVLRQSLFGQFSISSFADMEISSSIAVIRQLVELRMRRAFGVLSYMEEHSGKLIPLDLSALFECLKLHEDHITFPLKLENIERIYKWSNMYVHSGKTELTWIPYYIEKILRELTFGQKTAHGWDVRNGISASKETIQDIHSALLEGKSNLTIFSCPAECAHT